MDSRPVYLQGRGRGRGRGINPQAPAFQSYPYQQQQYEPSVPNKEYFAQTNYYNGTFGGPGAPGGKQVLPTRQSPEDCSPEDDQDGAAAAGRFQDAAAQHQRNVQRHLSKQSSGSGSGGSGSPSKESPDAYESSEEEEDMNDDSILQSMLKSFQGTGMAGDEEELGRTHEYLVNSVRPKANVCLICIETVKRDDPIWNCQGCHTIFHISCIQKWVKDGVYQQTKFDDDNSAAKSLPWNCPKCRHEYPAYECPTRYLCYCGKEEDPPFDPWLVPHSCGQTCGRLLKPECGHQCLLLCHPGPCPPCPQTVRVTCHCGSQPPQTRRCGSKEWTCGQPCGKELACGHHWCPTPCHPGECPACKEHGEQTCRCGSESSVRPCAHPDWQCDRMCGRTLPCGNHTCEAVCHSGRCGDCPRAGKRTCPCGKTEFEIPCTEDVPTCVDTCGKTLACGQHTCTQRCHVGPCGMCRQTSLKQCKCGARTKELPCYKEYTCDTKCSNMKDCRKHQCKRKCCDGNCQPCDQQCNKTLGCKNHKCSSRCHRGPCYPCPLTETISCACRGTSITVPCGREKVTKPPRCSKQCRKPPDCHHEARTPHRCHFGLCPPCKQVCTKRLPKCSHSCPAACHAAILARIQEKVQRAGPWEPKPESRIEMVEKPCPPCQVLVPVSCLGEHENVSVPCSVAVVSSCHRQCGRQLTCGNHFCQMECHRVDGAVDFSSAGSNCEVCEEPCSKPRPDGCSHPCLLPCHPGECPPCRQMIRMRCHCQLIVQHVECFKWTDASDREKTRLRSCPSRCPKTLPCGHQCTAICHPGACPAPEKCSERVKLRCPCKRKKREFVCNDVRTGYAKMECDDTCSVHKDKQKKEQEGKERAKKEEEERRQQEELAAFERKMTGRKRKPRKQRQVEEEPTFLEKYRKHMIGAVIAMAVAIIVYYLWTDPE